MAKKTLDKAKDVKNDEFFTKFNDVANELKHYLNQLRGKHILCPCDWNENVYRWKKEEELCLNNKYSEWIKSGGIKYSDELRCNFVRYLESQAKAYKFNVHFTGYYPGQTKELAGLYRFQESIPAYKKKYGKKLVIITNPPFSLFREFVKNLMENECKFLIIGAHTALTYKDFFQYFVNNKIWCGINNLEFFDKPKEVENTQIGVKKGHENELRSYCHWYTNLETPGNEYRNNGILLTCSYKGNENKYSKASNMDVLIVKKNKDIPKDYSGWMYVPTSFMTKYCPAQFEISNISTYHLYGINKACDIRDEKGKRMFMGIIIKNKKPQTEEVDW